MVPLDPVLIPAPPGYGHDAGESEGSDAESEGSEREDAEGGGTEGDAAEGAEGDDVAGGAEGEPVSEEDLTAAGDQAFEFVKAAASGDAEGACAVALDPTIGSGLTGSGAKSCVAGFEESAEEEGTEFDPRSPMPSTARWWRPATTETARRPSASGAWTPGSRWCRARTVSGTSTPPG